MEYLYRAGFASCRQVALNDGPCELKRAQDYVLATCEHQAALQLYDFLRGNDLFGVPIIAEGEYVEYHRTDPLNPKVGVEGRLTLWVETDEELGEEEAS